MCSVLIWLYVLKSSLDMADPLTYFISFFFLPLLVLHFVQVEAYDRKECHPFSCGSVPLIQFPFSNTSTPECGLYQITCANNSIPMIKLEDQERSYVVKSISYEAKQLVIQDDDLLRQRTHICNSLHIVTVPASPFLSFKVVTPNFTFFNCKHDQHALLQRPFELYNFTDCTDSVLYYYPNDSLPALTNNCSVFEFPISESQVDPYGSKRDLLTLLAVGFGLGWELTRECEECYEKKGGTCSLNGTNRDFICLGERGADKSKKKKLILGTTAGVGIFLLTCFLVFIICLVRKLPSDKFFFWRKKTHDSRNVEAFLENYGSVVPKRYRYSELKKMTNSFKDNLGQGGYGSVFKGKRDDGRFVAVKVLNNSKGGNGEEFINEVASIGRTYHVNVVTLLGFCSEGSKRALVYEFMPKGSLEKFIYPDKLGVRNALDCQKLFQIAVGIARGLEYLHRGCNTRIVHFDIKPHNILLDDDFCPKISDFGLAKLCPQQQSTLSMLDARGTIGYTAPEVFCRSIGGVSHKSDVYSYGMMVLEMIGGRKNIDAKAENTSEIYFPHWVYKHIELKESLGLLGFRTKAEEDIGRKMVLVGLWCIQTDPTNRPSMSRVLEMLEGSLGSLEMPPKPYLSSPSRSCSSTT